MKTKFNSIDLIIIIVLVFAVAFGGLFVYKKVAGKDMSNNVKVRVQVEFAKKDSYLTELPKVGDSVTIGVKEKMPAKVVKVEYKTAEVLSDDKDGGKSFWAEVPGKYDIYVTMEADAKDEKNAVTINGSAIRVGDQNAVRSEGWAGFGFVTMVDIVK